MYVCSCRYLCTSNDHGVNMEIINILATQLLTYVNYLPQQPTPGEDLSDSQTPFYFKPAAKDKRYQLKDLCHTGTIADKGLPGSRCKIGMSQKDTHGGGCVPTVTKSAKEPPHLLCQQHQHHVET